MFDTDGNGALDAREFKNLTRQTGSNLTDGKK
jgi:Ca2+-binding EF-hand superfamily protein